MFDNVLIDVFMLCYPLNKKDKAREKKINQKVRQNQETFVQNNEFLVF